MTMIDLRGKNALVTGSGRGLGKRYAVDPAPTYTARFLATRSVPDEEGRSRLQKIAQPQDMSDIVMFLCGPQSDALTGETIVCWK